MPIGNAIALGLLDGLTEFLPVSRTGHMSILKNLFEMTMPQDGHLLFDAMLRLAALFTLFVMYWSEWKSMFREMQEVFHPAPQARARRRYPYFRQLLMILLATLPLFLRLPFQKGLDRLLDNSFYIGAAIVLTGCMLYVADKMLPGKKSRSSLTVSDAVIIGICQLVGSFPGFSRTGAALVGGVAVGAEKKYAVHFALLIAVPALLVSFIVSLVQAFGQAVDWSSLPAYLFGTAAAVLGGVAAIFLLRLAANRGKFGGYAYYCWVAGVLSVILRLIF